MMAFSFVGNSQKVRAGACVIHCVPRSPAKPICQARQHSHRRSHFAKPLRGCSVLCAICVVCFHGSSMTTGRLQEDDRKSAVRFRPGFARNDGTFSRSLREAPAKPPRSHRGPTSTLRPFGAQPCPLVLKPNFLFTAFVAPFRMDLT